MIKMAVSSNSEFIDFIVPLGDRMRLYDPTKEPTDQTRNDAADPTKALPHGFIDAMIVREEVFVKEQNIPLANELDEDDHRSFHWVAYASVPAKATQKHDEKLGETRRESNSTKIPIGVIRLVPPPHPPHPSGKYGSDVHNAKECYIKLGRLAVVKEFRKAGISSLLINTALAFARNHPYELMPQHDAMQTMRQEVDRGVEMDFKGLVLVHAQTGVQKVWRRFGFETDESMGKWDEEGIEHVGMWKRMDVSSGRRKSKAFLGVTNPSNVD